MTTLVHGLAAAAVAAFFSAPAGAQPFSPTGLPSVPQAFGEPLRMTVVVGDARGDHRGWRDDRRRRGHGFGGVLLYDREYQGDSAWRSDSFNDWWHDRPDRAYPRWVKGNAQTCERMWYSGSVLRC